MNKISTLAANGNGENVLTVIGIDLACRLIPHAEPIDEPVVLSGASISELLGRRL